MRQHKKHYCALIKEVNCCDSVCKSNLNTYTDMGGICQIGVILYIPKQEHIKKVI